jgi:hypothetical protein
MRYQVRDNISALIINKEKYMANPIDPQRYMRNTPQVPAGSGAFATADQLAAQIRQDRLAKKRAQDAIEEQKRKENPADNTKL